MRSTTVFLALIMLSGCGIMQSSKDSSWVKKQRSLGLDPYHIQSCGPQAIQKVLRRFGIDSSMKDISSAIQSSHSCANLLRDVISVLDKEGRKITFPSEAKSILKKHGFNIVNINALEELNKDKDTALVLVKQKSSLNYHWMCFPSDENIKTFFGKDTVINEIYLIKNRCNIY